MTQITEEDVLVVRLSGTREEVLKQMADLLFRKGYVRETYADALLEREKRYPTGLELPGGVNVAIPHADIQHVIKQALVIGAPDGPIQFNSMEDPSKFLDVHVIFLLVINNPDGYVKFLSNLAAMFQEEQFLRLVRERLYEDLGSLILRAAMPSSKRA